MSTLKTSFAILTIILLTIAGTEYLFRIVFAIRDGTSDQVATSKIDDRALLPAYANADYDPAELWREIWAGTNVWLAYEPYTVWSRKPVTGKYVNVRKNGRRVTTGNSTEPDALIVWVFGGSTTWGMAVPDADTIPSRLSRRFNDAGIPTLVRNYGETGFVSTQDLLALVRALQKSEVPDLVIFYEGANESLGLVDRPDLINPHYLMNRIQGLFEGKTKTEQPALVLLRETALFRLATAIGNRIGTVRPDPAGMTYPTKIDAIPAVAATAVRAYENNLQIIKALGEEFGFQTYFFWQPLLGTGEKPLDPTEAAVLKRLNTLPQQEWMIRFTNELRAQVVEAQQKKQGHSHFFDIADIFSATQDPVFVDWAHVTHNGNAPLADKIFTSILTETCERHSREALNSRAGRLLALCGAGLH